MGYVLFGSGPATVPLDWTVVICFMYVMLFCVCIHLYSYVHSIECVQTAELIFEATLAELTNICFSL